MKKKMINGFPTLIPLLPFVITTQKPIKTKQGGKESQVMSEKCPSVF
jgi:hypothetical protein